ncbi:MAG TPA: phosphodiester glycosidase family protein [Polyangiaceae bacterium]
MSRGERTLKWLRLHARPALACSALGMLVAAWRGGAPGRDLEALTDSLRVAVSAGGGATVAASDLRWQPSEGVVADVVEGRWVMFLAQRAGDETRDVWRARARVSPEGAVIEVVDAHDLTNTPLGDDHALVVSGDHAAFATRAYGQEQSVTSLDLRGEGSQNRAEKLVDRVMAALTNLQQTGTFDGIGRIDVTLESPASAIGLGLGESALTMSLYDSELRHGPTRSASLDLAHSELSTAATGMRADESMHLPKRFSHWAVDTLRAVPWIGPVPVAWLEDEALTARDSYRRLTFHATGGMMDVVATAAPPPPVLDTSQASVEEAHWPPPRIQTIWKEPEEGEGAWTVPDVPFMRKVPGLAADAPSAFYRTFVRPDEERPYSKVLLVAMDLRQLDLDMEAGVEDPEPLTGPHGTGRIPREPAVYKRVAAAFNGAFKTEHGHYGMMVHKRVLLPPVPGAATVAVFDDGRVGFGTWGADRKVGGIVGVSDGGIVSFRQNLDALLDRGQVNPTGRNLWGFTLPGKGVQTERTGLCVTTSGHLLYAWGDDVSATSLAKAMKMAGCDYAMHLDMNPYHTGFLFTAIDDLAAKKYKSQLLTSGMSIPTERYIQYSPKDFFYMMVHDPTPPGLDGGTPWAADGGTQPPPAWMPGIWAAHVDGPEGSVELVDVEPGRATWRVRAGALESPASTPLRELTGDDARRVLFAVGAGVAADKRPRGIATDGRLAVPVHGGADSGVLVVRDDGSLSLVRGTDGAVTVDAHGDLLELPIILWDGSSLPATPGPVGPRSAIGMTSGGRVVFARGTFASESPLAEALARAGCTRAVSLDRGASAAAFLDRAGGSNPPRARYDETVLYAVATPLQPRGFRFDASTVAVQSGKH